MSSKKKNLAKQFQQNKVNRVVKSEKRYNKEKRSKSDEAYIKGDYKSSVSLRSYGVKKALANGEKVSGYGDDYIDTKGMKRSNYIKKQNGENPYEAKYLYVGGKPKTITSDDGSKFKTRTRYLTDEEKESYENTGELYHKNYRKAKSYLDTERHEGGKFSDRLKTFDGNKIKWDGLETAKYNQKDGKHLKNLGHYAIGLGKDLIADPVVDFLKGVDRYESAITNGVYAGVEQLSNIADGKGATKDLIKDVVKHSFKESDETGWGTSSADNWRNMAKRNGAEISPLEDKILGATGFVADILNPIDLGGKVSGVAKAGLKGAKNTLKGISNATDIMSHAPGFVPKSLTDFRGKGIVKASEKSSGASDDVFFGLKTNKSLDNTEVDRRLNNAYDVAMSKREPIKTGKPKVDSFIEMLESKPKINEQRHIDGRKLNKTKTQTKDGYVPNVIENVSDDVIEQVSDSNQISFFDEVRSKLRRKGSSEEGAMFSYNAKPFNDAFLDRGKAVDEIGEYLDIADETENFNFLKAMSEAKKVQNIMNVNSKENRLTLDLLEAFYKRKADMDKGLIPYDKEFLTNFKKLTNGKMDDINAIRAEEHALRERNLVDDFINIITKKDTKVSGSKEARKKFAIGVSDISNNIANDGFDNEELLKSLGEIANNNIDPKTTQKALNNLLFDGKEVLVKASKKDYQEFSETISELVNFQKALKHLNTTGEALEIPLSNSTRRMLGISDSTKVTVNNLKKGNKVINNPEEIYNLISNTLIDKSRSLTDRRYWEKQEMLAKEFKYKKFNDVREEFKQIEYKYNTLKNAKRTNQTEKQFQEVSKRYNELKDLIENRTNLYDLIKDMDANQFDKFISENYPNHMRGMKVYSTQQNKINSYVKHRDAKYKEVFDEVIDKERHNVNVKSAEYYGIDDMEYEDMRIIYDSYKDGSLKSSDMTKKEKSIIQYMSAKEEAGEINKLNNIHNDRVESFSKEKGYTEKLKERRKTYNLSYVNWKATPNIPKESMNYKILSTHKDTKNAINNIKATMFNAYKLKFSGGSVDEIDLLVELKRENINALRKMGIPDEAYFNEMKDISLQMLEYAKNNFKAPEKYKSKNMSDIHNKKLAEQQEKVKKTKLSNDVNKRWGIFDKRDSKFNAHQEFDIPDTYKLIDFNESSDKALIKLANKNAIEEEYQRILNSSNIDELLIGHNTPSYKELVPQSGDNISKINKPNTYVDDMSDVINGTESVFNYLNKENRAKHIMNSAKIEDGKQTKIDGRTLNKKYTQTKDGYIPQIKEETPLDSVARTTDEQLNLFDKMFGKTPKEEKAINNIPKDMQEQKLQELDEKIAKRMTPQRMAEILGEPLEDVLKNANKPVNINGEEIAQGWRKNADKTGVPNGVEWEDLFKEDKGIKEVFEELSSKGIDATQQPPKEKPQNMDKNLYQKWLNAWKKGVTIYNPGWHVQNFFQNKAQNYFALGNKAFMPQTDAKNILKTIKGKDAKSVNINGMSNNELAKLANDLGVVDSFGDDIQLAQNGFLGKLENSWVMQKPQEIEKNARLHHWLEQMKNGMTPEEAARSVNKYLYDYSKENKFDRAIKHVDPFWTFHKNNARMLTTSAIEHPSRMNNIMRANRGLEGDISEEYKQDEEAMYREYQDPTKTYTDHKDRQYNYLYNQDVFSDISDAIPLSQDSLVGKLNPLIQIALRTAKGEGKFGNKIVDSNKSIEDGWDELLYEDAGYNKVSSNVAIKDALLDVNPILPGLVETIDAINADKYKANNGGMPQEIADKRALNEWIKLITGHKGNWYRNTK